MLNKTPLSQDRFFKLMVHAGIKNFNALITHKMGSLSVAPGIKNLALTIMH
jgi:hypothetical protein